MKQSATWAVGTAVLLAAAVVFAAGKQETGRVNGNQFIDRSYGFSFQKYDSWKYAKIAQEDPAKPLRIRFTLTQNNYFIPADRRPNQESFTPPGLGLWVDTTSLSVEAFAAQVVDTKSKMKWRRTLGQAEPIIDKGNPLETGKIQIGGQDGVRQLYRMEYEAQLYDRTKDRYNVINDALIGDLFITKYGGRAYVFFFRCERTSYPAIKDEVKNMILTMNFNPPADTSGGGAR